MWLFIRSVISSEYLGGFPVEQDASLRRIHRELQGWLIASAMQEVDEKNPHPRLRKILKIATTLLLLMDEEVGEDDFDPDELEKETRAEILSSLERSFLNSSSTKKDKPQL